MIDIVRHIEATQREVGRATTAAGDAHVIRLRRQYAAPIDDVWDALTNPDRIGRWFLPISGDLRPGGSFQFEGNAGGRILECDRPNGLHVTWAYGEGEASDIQLRLSPVDAERTTFELEHTAVVPDGMWEQFGPGAVGVGWDGGFLGLALHLATGHTVDDPLSWALTDEGRAFHERSSQAWGDASLAAGADPDAVARMVSNTTAFYTTAPEG